MIYGSNTLSGIFMGYYQKKGGYWNEQVAVLDWEELQEASSASSLKLKRIGEKEITIIKPFRFQWRREG